MRMSASRARYGVVACALAAAVALNLLALMTARADTARAATQERSEYVVASLPIKVSVGIPGVVHSVDAAFCVFAGASCLTFSTFFEFTPSETTIWADASSPNFGDVVGGLIDGDTDLFFWALRFVTASSPLSELDLLDGQVGPSGVDLAGYTINRIGLRVDVISFASPGAQDPTGLSTDVIFEGAFLFEGRIASKETCLEGGRHGLHGPGGTDFENQGQCIKLVTTGR
jgi:hypothetical protein